MPEVKSPADPGRSSAPPVVDEQSARTFRGLRDLAERIAPWLVDVGSWIFGGLTAVNLVVLSALIAALDDLALRAFQDAGFPEIDAYFPSPAASASQHAKRSRVALLYALGIAALSTALTTTGTGAAVWHMGRWIALVFLSAVILSTGLVMVAIAHALPSESAAEKALKLRYREGRPEGINRLRG
jgi:hypothetical protein